MIWPVGLISGGLVSDLAVGFECVLILRPRHVWYVLEECSSSLADEQTNGRSNADTWVRLPSSLTSPVKLTHSPARQVARDACGTPLRPFWPYVMDPQSIESVRREQVFEVGSCWNGVVAFKAGLVAYQGMQGAGMMNATGVSEVRKRGWQMVDNGAFFAVGFGAAAYALRSVPSLFLHVRFASFPR
jgi:hypothetical protein